MICFWTIWINGSDQRNESWITSTLSDDGKFNIVNIASDRLTIQNGSWMVSTICTYSRGEGHLECSFSPTISSLTAKTLKIWGTRDLRVVRWEISAEDPSPQSAMLSTVLNQVITEAYPMWESCDRYGKVRFHDLGASFRLCCFRCSSSISKTFRQYKHGVLLEYSTHKDIPRKVLTVIRPTYERRKMPHASRWNFWSISPQNLQIVSVDISSFPRW